MKSLTYRPTKRTKELLQRIDRAQILIDGIPVTEAQEKNLRHESLLKSSLFSAKIEGNRLRLDQLTMAGLAGSEDQEKLEVANVLAALRFIRSSRSPRKLSLSLVKKIHQLTMKGLSGEAGRWRRKPSAIFNQAGLAVRMNPSPQSLPELLKRWLTESQKAVNTEPAPVAAALTHVAFEKLHPFVDGNGRVGRLISQFILQRGGYGFKGLVTFEEYLSDHRQEYYDLLAEDKREVTDFVSFFLRAIAESAEAVVTKLQTQPESSPEDSLLPRRRELLWIIRDHQPCSFDFLHRRFLKINVSTLRYDLQQLVKAGLVKKLGATRGALYEAK